MARPQFFSGNYGSPLGSFSNAANIIAQAGAQEGQMFANLGKIAASTLDKFREKKEEKMREDQFEEVAKKLPIETFAPFNVKNEEERDELLKVFKKKDSRNEVLQLAALAQQGQARQGQQGFRKLMYGQKPAEVPVSDSPIRDTLLREKAIDDARGMATERDPEAFRRRVQQMVNAGQLNPQGQDLALNRLMQLQAAQQANAPKPLSVSDQIAIREEERKTKEFQQEQEAAKPKAPPQPIYMESALEAIDDALKYVDKDSKLFLNPTAGFGAETMAKIGGTDAADLEAALQTITSAVGFKRLQDMRDASPTGGALGQVSERELAQLNAALGSISQKQSPEQLKKNLLRIKDHYRKAVNAINAQRLAFQQGKSFKNEQEALDFINSQNQDSGIQTKQGNYKIKGLQVTEK